MTKRTNKLHSPELKTIFNENDIVLLTETWTNELCDLHVKHFVLNRTENKTSSKRSSGGIIVYLISQLVTENNLVFTSCDDILCIRISDDKFGLKIDLYFCLCYIVPENSSIQDMMDVHTFDRLLTFITELQVTSSHECNFVLCEMNAHTSNYADFVINDSDFIDVLPLDYIFDEPMHIQHKSQDKGRLNNHGIMLLDMCKQTGLCIFERTLW